MQKAAQKKVDWLCASKYPKVVGTLCPMLFCSCSALTSCFNPVMGTGNYSATSNNTKLVHWLLMGGVLHLVQGGGSWAGPLPAQAPPRWVWVSNTRVQNVCKLLRWLPV